MENLAIDDTIGWGIFAEAPVGDQVRVIAELFGRITPSAGFDRQTSPTEFMAGVKSAVGPTFVLGGLGFGLVNGYGTPTWRAFLGVGIPTATTSTVVEQIPRTISRQSSTRLDRDSGRIELSDRIHFPTNSAELDPESHSVLDEVAELLAESPEYEQIRIEGHTDDRGSRDHNISLSRDRANSVRTYLIGQGIEPNRLTTRGVGPDEPIGDNDTEEGRRQNRRVEFHIVDGH